MLRAEVRPLALLAVVLVLVTMAAVAVVAHAIVPGMSWGAAFVLGAIVGPTDPVAATATFSRLGAPARVRGLVEGEAMINDGTSLVAYNVALGAVVARHLLARRRGARVRLLGRGRRSPSGWRSAGSATR